MDSTASGAKIWVTGIVQGVGFRPFIYNLAARCQITGWVRNTSSGVEIEINGFQSQIQAFLNELRINPPPLARIDTIKVEDCTPNGYIGFIILESQPQPGDFMPISPDVGICPDCQRELFDPADRRYRYPFINCTNCGPRFTIIQDIPYDRPKTTMATFPLCPECGKEYHNPVNRRFHAQPVACPVCGPHIWFEAQGKLLGEREEAIQVARSWLKAGKILAIKGLGGFHLACDAANHQAMAELRNRKKRSDKPFALMAFNESIISKYAHVSPSEEALLRSRQNPIVLLPWKKDTNLVPEIAPAQNTLGFMLPYTPLHLLLLEPEPGYPEVLVMTSGNLSEEPIAYQDEEANTRLTGLADGFLLHNRPIHMRVDDSVAKIVGNETYFIRRSRGYAPDPIRLPKEIPSLLAAGAELKNTFCLTRKDYAFLSHHIGDMENYETLRSFEEGISHFERLFRVNPQFIACDLHPNYLATRYAQQRAQSENLPLIQVQHHHAHLAACLADNHWQTSDPVIGLSFDGTGYGTDGTIWGGEVLVGSYDGYQRHAHLKYVPLPGGDVAVRKPARMALSHLWASGIDWESDLPAVEALCSDERNMLLSQITRQINSPLTSSMGRLFDAASALLGIRSIATYEGQAAIEMEMAADENENGWYDFDIQNGVIDPAPVWISLIHDWRKGLKTPVLAARFHNSVCHLALQLCLAVRQQTQLNTAALSGGVWQNNYLLSKTIHLLKQNGFTVLWHHQVPTNDGSIALGQAMIAATFIERGELAPRE